VEPSATAIAALLRRETGRRAVSLDPNVRPLAVGDVGAFRLRFEELLACASIVKASEEDVQAFYGPADLGEVATDWLRRGPRLVVFTRGPTGPLAFTASGRIERPAPRVDVVDTVGAGDTFHGALLAALSMDGLLSPGMPDLDAARLVRALDFAAAAASLVCARRGADPPTLAEVAAFMPTGA
jgi:fructokinase